MDSIIIEKMETCLLVKQDSEYDGHGDFGEREYYTYNYVIVNGCKEKIYKGMYIIHDGKRVYDTGYISHMKDNLRRLLDEEYEVKLKEERKQHYLKLKKEFEHEK